jgi:hypothetical protein
MKSLGDCYRSNDVEGYNELLNQFSDRDEQILEEILDAYGECLNLDAVKWIANATKPNETLQGKILYEALSRHYARYDMRDLMSSMGCNYEVLYKILIIFYTQSKYLYYSRLNGIASDLRLHYRPPKLQEHLEKVDKNPSTWDQFYKTLFELKIFGADSSQLKQIKDSCVTNIIQSTG